MKEAPGQQDRLKALISLARSGDNEAFEEIYKDYYTPLFRYIVSRVKDRSEAEDMTQIVFIKIFNKLPSWDPDHTSPLAFFFTVARNTLIDYFRKNSHREIASDEIVNSAVDSADRNDLTTLREVEDSMHQAIMKLSPEQQEIITLFYIKDLTYKEIADITQKREDAIRQIHSRAIKKLRQLYVD